MHSLDTETIAIKKLESDNEDYVANEKKPGSDFSEPGF